jgi:hypothetical protein
MAERKKKMLLTAALKTALINCFDELKIAYPNYPVPVLHEKHVSRLQTIPSSDIELEFTHDRPSGSQVGRGKDRSRR